MKPTGASVCNREARLAVCPIGVYSTFPPVSTERTTTSAGINPDPSIECVRSLSGPTLSVFAQFPLHLECGIKASLRVVLMRQRRTEQGEDAIARGLHDVALVAAHRVDHDLESRVHDRARFFGIEV